MKKCNKHLINTCFLILLVIHTTSCSVNKSNDEPLFSFSSESQENNEYIQTRRLPRDNPGGLSQNKALLPPNRKPFRTKPSEIIPQYQALGDPYLPTQPNQTQAPKQSTTPFPALRPSPQNQHARPTTPPLPGNRNNNADQLFIFTPPTPSPELALPPQRPSSLEPLMQEDLQNFNSQGFMPAPGVEEISPWIPETQAAPNALNLPSNPSSYFMNQPQQNNYWNPAPAQPQYNNNAPQEPFNNPWQPPVLNELQPFPPATPYGAAPSDMITSPDQMQPWIQEQPFPPAGQAPIPSGPEYWQPAYPQNNMNPNQSWQPPTIAPNAPLAMPYQESFPPIQQPLNNGYAPQPFPMAPSAQPYEYNAFPPAPPIPSQPPPYDMRPQGQLKSDLPLTLAMSDRNFPNLRSVPPTPEILKNRTDTIPIEINKLQKKQKDIEKKRNDIHDIAPESSIEPSEATSDNIS